ncbi:MAG: 16S rRNA (cytosine(1402)-N(4))-methyltransferase RsmH [Erysipelotrichaceae bacterium]|nr:16S rRNA (cytosine(1402)-N(4))-methyltransferase RsmH [Erysipelotrichaceae bacterium]
MQHESVLLHESIELLQVKDDGVYVDCTLGRGGHTCEILKRCTKGHVFALDCDPKAIEESKPRLDAIGHNYTCIHTTFDQLKTVLNAEQVSEVDGILLDLGVSSPQFDDPQRGFSYRSDARLDMRMDLTQALDAWQVVNTYSQEQLATIIKQYGEDPFATRIAQAIVTSRETQPIDTTFQFVDVIKSAMPQKELRKKKHPAKRTFQAIRMEVNSELSQLQSVLRHGLELLGQNGRMAVITFHSLEDRMVKQEFKKVAVPKKVDKRLPQQGIESLEYQLINKKPIKPTQDELDHNNRAHSAKLRGIERIRKEVDV